MKAAKEGTRDGLERTKAAVKKGRSFIRTKSFVPPGLRCGARGGGPVVAGPGRVPWQVPRGGGPREGPRGGPGRVPVAGPGRAPRGGGPQGGCPWRVPRGGPRAGAPWWRAQGGSCGGCSWWVPVAGSGRVPVAGVPWWRAQGGCPWRVPRGGPREGPVDGAQWRAQGGCPWWAQGSGWDVAHAQCVSGPRPLGEASLFTSAMFARKDLVPV